MRKLILLTFVAVFLASISFAQDVPKVEVFGGYSLLHLDTEGGPTENMNGWAASVTGNFNRFLGVTAEVTGEYKTETFAGVDAHLHMHNFMFGPQVGYRSSKIRPFGHFLIGVSHASAEALGVSDSDNSFAWELGGGVDVKLNKLASVRLGQVDLVQTRFNDDTRSDFRYAAGIVLNLGSK